MSPVLRVVSFLYKQSLSELVAQLVELRELMPEVWMVFIYPKCVRNTKNCPQLLPENVLQMTKTSIVNH